MKQCFTVRNTTGKADAENGGCIIDLDGQRLLGFGTFPYKRAFLSNVDLEFEADVHRVEGKRYLKLEGIQPVDDNTCKFVVEVQKRKNVPKGKIRYFLAHHSIKDLDKQNADFFQQKHEFSHDMAVKFQEVFREIFKSCAMTQRLKHAFRGLSFEEREDIADLCDDKDVFENPFVYWPSKASKVPDRRKQAIVEDMRRRLGISDHDDRRVVAYMKHVLLKEVRSGHCFMAVHDFKTALFGEDNLGCSNVDVDRVCNERRHEFYTNGAEMFLTTYYNYEANIADKIKTMLDEEKDDFFDDVCSEGLDDTQTIAVTTALTHKLSFICGGPGTGKTQVIRSILKSLPTSPVYLLAPTHRATKRLREVCGVEATTFQHIVSKSEHTDKHDYTNGTFVIDEISMMDVAWASRFFNQFAAIARRIVLIGDHFQLPSVGAGAIARDLYGHPLVPQVELKKCYRTNNLTISENSALLRQEKLTPFTEDETFRTVQYGDALDSFLELELVHEEEAYSPSSPLGVKILCQTNRHVGAANRIAQALFNPKGAPSPYAYWEKVAEKKRQVFRKGDRVKLVEPQKDAIYLHPGDEGTIVDWEDNGAVVVFDGGSRKWIEKPQHIDLAYATTIHKSQGGEFSNVFVVLSKYMPQCLESVYTGITRAKDRCVLFYPTQTVLMKARTNRLKRRTKLRHHLNKRSREVVQS